MTGIESFKLRLFRLQPSETWTNESGSEDELTFVLVKAGVGTYQVQNATQRLVAGTVVFFYGRSVGKLCAAPKNDLALSTFSVLPEHIYPLFSSNEVGLLDNVLANFRSAKVYPADGKLAIECRAMAELPEHPSTLVQRSHLLRIVAAVLAEEFESVQGQRSGQNWAEDHMIQVFEKLSSAELLNLSVNDLAARFNCSRRHLNRLFHQHFGLSITALRMEIRLLKAVSLLRNPQAKVINVAEQCGFNHLGLFNTCFKRRFGVSPGQWRKSGITVPPLSASPGNQAHRPVMDSRPDLLAVEGAAPEPTGPISGSVAAVIGRMLDPAPGVAHDISHSHLGKAASRSQP